jgi:putative ABC transport system substrate-binding protein
MTFCIGRREFMTLVGGAAAWPLTARAQQPAKMRRIGVLMSYAETDPEGQARLGAFLQALALLGWTIGRNVHIDTRWAAPEDADSRQRFAKDLVALQPDLILSHNTPATAALLQQTRTIPIIFANVADPVGSGFVANFPRPGGNVTGFTPMEGSMAGKWVELLKEIARVASVAFLFNPATAPYAEYYLNPFKAAAAAFAVEAIVAPVHDTSELESVVAAQARRPNCGLIVMTDSFTTAHRAEITSLAARYRLPAVYPYRFFTELGGLLSYGIDPLDNFRRAASYADRILKGAKPSELPVQAPVKFELAINLKTAKALGLDVPATLLARADEVIE